MALRMAARSTTAGTPVKSCSTTRAGLKGISTSATAVRLPAGQVLDVVLGHLVAVAVPQHRFQQHADRVRQPADLAQPQLLQLGQPIDPHRAAAGFNRVTSSKWVKSRLGLSVIVVPVFLKCCESSTLECGDSSPLSCFLRSHVVSRSAAANSSRMRERFYANSFSAGHGVPSPGEERVEATYRTGDLPSRRRSRPI